jgi:hypothetical protein
MAGTLFGFAILFAYLTVFKTITIAALNWQKKKTSIS